VLDLLFPVECGGCGMPSTRWCAECAKALKVGDDQPHLVAPRVDPGAPVFSLGRYAGVRRRVIVELKEHGRTELIAPLARALAIGIHRLLEWRMVVSPLTVVPGPTRASAARRRGGDPVFRMVVAATRGHPDLSARKALRTAAFVRDSVGLDSASRERNVAGRIRLLHPVRGAVLLVDDIVTTGVTARESVLTLTRQGACVVAVLALAHA
jgi:predicted amidophosphoribosyltransferase